MSNNTPSLLFVSDLYYDAQQRIYYEEDVFLSSQLKDDFDIAICHPLAVQHFEDNADLIVFRNTGPVIYYKEQYLGCRKRLMDKKSRVFNNLTGKADMLGKQYLVDLTQMGLPVTYSIDTAKDIPNLPVSEEYVVKSKDGADSIGMKYISADEVKNLEFNNELLQPKIDFEYEVSFYFIDCDFQYGMYAPNIEKRWQLEEYNPSSMDLEFAKKFIDWNDMKHGIQRVDACRTKSGDLLLVELEDLNPYLSILEVEKDVQSRFIERFRRSLLEMFAE